MWLWLVAPLAYWLWRKLRQLGDGIYRDEDGVLRDAEGMPLTTDTDRQIHIHYPC